MALFQDMRPQDWVVLWLLLMGAALLSVWRLLEYHGVRTCGTDSLLVLTAGVTSAILFYHACRRIAYEDGAARNKVMWFLFFCGGVATWGATWAMYDGPCQVPVGPGVLPYVAPLLVPVTALFAYHTLDAFRMDMARPRN